MTEKDGERGFIYARKGVWSNGQAILFKFEYRRDSNERLGLFWGIDGGKVRTTLEEFYY